MERTAIYEGTVMVEPDTGKVYLVAKPSNKVVDLNTYIAKLVGEKVIVGNSENL